jgi:hypothetical protein
MSLPTNFFIARGKGGPSEYEQFATARHFLFHTACGSFGSGPSESQKQTNVSLINAEVKGHPNTTFELVAGGGSPSRSSYDAIFYSSGCGGSVSNGVSNAIGNSKLQNKGGGMGVFQIGGYDVQGAGNNIGDNANFPTLLTWDYGQQGYIETNSTQQNNSALKPARITAQDWVNDELTQRAMEFDYLAGTYNPANDKNEHQFYYMGKMATVDPYGGTTSDLQDKNGTRWQLHSRKESNGTRYFHLNASPAESSRSIFSVNSIYNTDTERVLGRILVLMMYWVAGDFDNNPIY